MYINATVRKRNGRFLSNCSSAQIRGCLCRATAETRFDVDDGNGKEEEGDEGAEGAGRAGECPADTPAAVYRSMRDASEFQDEKIDRRQNRWDQFFIQRENEWKEQVRTAYDEAAIVADREEQLLRENAELRAKISKLEAPSHVPPSPLVE